MLSATAAGVLGSTAASRAALAGGASAPADRFAWFKEARYGMFIHWGLYAIPARGEWDQYQSNTSGAEYEKYASQFNPVQFNARQWVSLAKEAGMRYLVITTKHHDGFCMFDTKLTDYNIVKATPFGRDPIKEISQECARQGVRFCVYYSVKDWHHPQYPTLYTFRTKLHPDGFHGFPNQKADYIQYLDYLQGQLRELLANYGPIGTIFFDWSGDAFEDERERRRGLEIVDMIHKLQPGCLINNRFGGLGADYGTPEQTIPDGHSDRLFEVCQTMNGSWGYNRRDTNWKSARTVVEQLCDTASKGGNYLLNVGPTDKGVILEESASVLRQAGKWLERNGEAVHGASGGPDMRWQPDIKMVTTKPGKYYLHVFDWPSDRTIFYWDFRRRLTKAYLLADPDRRPLKVDAYRRSVSVHVPADPPDPINSIVVLEYA